MTVAEKMRALAEQALADKVKEKEKDHKRYVKNLILGKIQKSALKGNSKVKVKVAKWYSQSLVAEILIENGFKVDLIAENGKHYVVVKW